MATKVIKILIIKDDISSSEKEIYCVKLTLNDDLAGLKEKIYSRCPLLKELDYQIYWLDSDNDEILITCDDDFKFFVDESHVSKLTIKIIQDEPTLNDVQPIRKRLHRQTIDDQQSKKLRAQLENIELSSSDSSLSDLEGISSDTDLTATSTSSLSKNVEEEVIKIDDEKAEDHDVMMDVESDASKVKEITEQNKPKIINVEYLPNIYLRKGISSVENVVNTENNVTKELSKKEEVLQSASVVVEHTDSQKPSTSISTNSSSSSSEIKIVISDSSSDEEEEEFNSNKKQESPNFTNTSAYAFAGNINNGQSQFTGTFFDDSGSQFTRKQSRRQEKQQDKYHRRAQHSYHKAENAYMKAQQRSEDYQQMQRERAQEQQRRSQEYVRRAQEQASRFSQRISNASAASPYQGLFQNIQESVQQTILSTRNTLFRVADINQKVFNN